MTKKKRIIVLVHYNNQHKNNRIYNEFSNNQNRKSPDSLANVKLPPLKKLKRC